MFYEIVVLKILIAPSRMSLSILNQQNIYDTYAVGANESSGNVIFIPAGFFLSLFRSRVVNDADRKICRLSSASPG